jgi:NADH dehydrogenase/NADH:ubiquinone oxidoreductase subunit G
VRGTEIMRILPRLNEDINEEWISDKTRYSYDGLKRQRLDTPLIRHGDDFRPASWEEAFNAIKKGLTGVRGNEVIILPYHTHMKVYIG